MLVGQKSFASQVAMVLLAVTLALVSMISNGSFLAIFARFKNLRNFPNILFTNLSVVDFLSALLNLPLFVVYFVPQTSWLKGKAWAVISSSINVELTLANIIFMFALMLDRFLAICLDLKYLTWKTTKKAYFAVFLMWLACTIAVASASAPLIYMDFDDLSLAESRKIIFHERKGFIASFMVIFIIATTVLGILTSYTIVNRRTSRMLLNLPPLQAEARLKMDIKATKTVAMAVGTYFICYIPAAAFAVWRYDNQEIVHPWFAFLANFCIFVSGALNPIIYVLRNRRYRSAIRQLLKDPCGRGPFQERPQIKRKEGEKHGAQCTIPKENLQSEASGTTEATSQFPRPNKVAKIAWQENEVSSDHSLDERIAVPNVHACLDGLEVGEREEDQDFNSSGLVGNTDAKQNMDEKKRKGTYLVKNRVEPGGEHTLEINISQ